MPEEPEQAKSIAVPLLGTILTVVIFIALHQGMWDYALYNAITLAALVISNNFVQKKYE